MLILGNVLITLGDAYSCERSRLRNDL